MTISLPLHRPRVRRLAVASLLAVAWLATATTALADPRRGGDGLEVHAHTLRHRQVSEVVPLLRPHLSQHGTVEEQPASNTLVVRDTPTVLARVQRLIASLDRPPAALRFEIQLVRATPDGGTRPVAAGEVPPEVAERLRKLLRYDHYEVLANAGVAAREGQAVTYSLSDTYHVSFRPGSTVDGHHLRLEGFRIVKQPPQTNKGRRLPPRELFGATLNLRLGRPLTLVLAEAPGQEGTSEEGLMVAIVCHREDDDR